MGSDASKCPVSAPNARASSTAADKKARKEKGRERRAHSIGPSPAVSSHKVSVISNRDRESSLSPRTSEERSSSPEESSDIKGEMRSASDFDKPHFMQRRDRMLIVKSWKKTQKTGAEHVGSKIFLRVLTAEPEIKAIFGLEKIPQGRLKYDPRFRQHAIVYTKTLDYVVKNLEFSDKLEHHFDQLGKKHVAMQGRGFNPTYWDTFAECMTQAAAEWDQHRHRPTTSAWRTLIQSIIAFMRHGYDEEQGRRRSLFPRTVGSTTTGNGTPVRKVSAYAVMQSNSNGNHLPAANGGAPAGVCPYANATYNTTQAQQMYQVRRPEVDKRVLQAYANGGAYDNGYSQTCPVAR